MDIPWIIEKLNKRHQRPAFACGNDSLDQFLKTLANQYARKRVGQTYIAIKSGDAKIDGYYTVCAGSIGLDSLPEAVRHQLPKHPVPTLHLGRLAVDQSVQGHGLGRKLLVHCLALALNASQSLGIYAVDAIAIDDAASQFYQKFGFTPLDDRPRHLLLTLKNAEAIFSRE